MYIKNVVLRTILVVIGLSSSLAWSVPDTSNLNDDLFSRQDTHKKAKPGFVEVIRNNKMVVSIVSSIAVIAVATGIYYTMSMTDKSSGTRTIKGSDTGIIVNGDQRSQVSSNVHHEREGRKPRRPNDGEGEEADSQPGVPKREGRKSKEPNGGEVEEEDSQPGAPKEPEAPKASKEPESFKEPEAPKARGRGKSEEGVKLIVVQEKVAVAQGKVDKLLNAINGEALRGLRDNDQAYIKGKVQAIAEKIKDPTTVEAGGLEAEKLLETLLAGENFEGSLANLKRKAANRFREEEIGKTVKEEVREKAAEEVAKRDVQSREPLNNHGFATIKLSSNINGVITNAVTLQKPFDFSGGHTFPHITYSPIIDYTSTGEMRVTNDRFMITDQPAQNRPSTSSQGTIVQRGNDGSYDF